MTEIVVDPSAAIAALEQRVAMLEARLDRLEDPLTRLEVRG
jgi:uncharacterized protein YceH (UPF0502 family)